MTELSVVQIAGVGAAVPCIPLLDVGITAFIHLQCIFSYTVLANPELEPHESVSLRNGTLAAFEILNILRFL